MKKKLLIISIAVTVVILLAISFLFKENIRMIIPERSTLATYYPDEGYANISFGLNDGSYYSGNYRR